MERLRLSVHCAEPGRKYNERKSAEHFLCYHTNTEKHDSSEMSDSIKIKSLYKYMVLWVQSIFKLQYYSMYKYIVKSLSRF